MCVCCTQCGHSECCVVENAKKFSNVENKNVEK